MIAEHGLLIFFGCWGLVSVVMTALVCRLIHNAKKSGPGDES